MANGFQPTQLQQIGQALGGFGAGIQGNLPQFQQVQAQRQQQQLRQQQAQQQASQEAEKERQETVFFDADAALKLFNQDDLDGVVAVGMNRLQAGQNFPGVDLSDTQRVTQLAIAARNGSEEAKDLLKNELESAVRIGKATGVLAEVEVPTGRTEIGQLQEDLQNQLITQEQFDSEVAKIQVEPEEERKTAKDINDRLRFVDTGELVFADVEVIEKDKPEKFTSGQRLAAGFAERTRASGDTITELGSQFTGFGSGIAGALPQRIKSDDRQLFEQATRNFVNATLRRESGAAIAPSEFDNANLQYIPQAGDSEAVLELKQRNRETISRSLQLEAGEAFNQLRESLDQVPLSTPFTPVPATEPEGTEAVNNEGLTIIVRDGQWVAK